MTVAALVISETRAVNARGAERQNPPDRFLRSDSRGKLAQELPGTHLRRQTNKFACTAAVRFIPRTSAESGVPDSNIAATAGASWERPIPRREVVFVLVARPPLIVAIVNLCQ